MDERKGLTKIIKFIESFYFQLKFTCSHLITETLRKNVSGGWGVKNFTKVFAGGEGGQKFLFWWGDYIVAERAENFVGESRNFEVK